MFSKTECGWYLDWTHCMSTTCPQRQLWQSLTLWPFSCKIRTLNNLNEEEHSVVLEMHAEQKPLHVQRQRTMSQPNMNSHRVTVKQKGHTGTGDYHRSTLCGRAAVLRTFGHVRSLLKGPRSALRQCSPEPLISLLHLRLPTPVLLLLTRFILLQSWTSPTVSTPDSLGRLGWIQTQYVFKRYYSLLSLDTDTRLISMGTQRSGRTMYKKINMT